MVYDADHEAKRLAKQHISDACREYGMYGGIFYHAPCALAESDLNRFYIVAGIDPALQGDFLPPNLDPSAIIRRSQRNNLLFYPKTWAFDLSENSNKINVTDSLVEYLKKAEFIRMLYAQYGMDPPDKIRISEFYQLREFHETAYNFNLPASVREKAKKDLAWFFRRERSTGFRRRWLDYFRSEHFPDDQGAIQKLVGYFRQTKQRTTIQQLIEVNEDVHKLQMEEHEYKLFTRFLRNVYPDVRYAAKDKEIVNHGGIGNPKETYEDFGRRVSGEEYAVILKDRFAAEGYKAIADLKQAYWEFRDVYYKACDEPLVAAAYNSITLQYAKCDPLADLPEPLHMIDVPLGDFMNFVSLAKTNHLLFYIDNTGLFSVPSLKNIHVIYSAHQQQTLDGIVARMIDDKVEFSHMLDSDPQRPALSQVIDDLDRFRIQHQPEHIIPPDLGRD